MVLGLLELLGTISKGSLTSLSLVTYLFFGLSLSKLAVLVDVVGSKELKKSSLSKLISNFLAFKDYIC